MYAIVRVGNKQYRVEQGDSLLVDRLRADEGDKVPLEALLLADGKDSVLDRQELEKVKVEATVRGHERGPKVRVLKFKPKKGYKRRTGHRSELTRLEVGEIKKLSRRPAGQKAAAEKPAAEKKPAAAKKPAAKKPAAKKAAQRKPAQRKKEDGDGS